MEHTEDATPGEVRSSEGLGRTAAHTPGPWVVGNGNPLLFGRPHGAGTEPLGFVYGPSHAELSEHGRECLANARLCAAAPDLLAALYEALEFAEDQEAVIDGPYGQPQANNAMTLAQTLRAAIAKATGLVSP